MKKAIILTTLLAVSTVSMAKGDGDDRHRGGYHDGKGQMQQGFFDESLAVKTVADALKASDDTPALLEGKIVKQIDKDEFTFQDATGEIQIDVSKHAWQGQTISPQDTIQIRGKVDSEWGKTEIDVKQVTKK
ncbi:MULTISPECIES: YgiW/YdeI family stress tolerance OB fold protein [Glaesserella]|uniref:TIGR00156 family protein n=1 Tax=Glaesserella australis TaxID=2094024 RepID=A0A328C2D1_9PAST|nr:MULTISPECIES: NirD/YgiW/YdeI family stress tolerance protein [Glaesserella]AUI66890.1 TIGR00156 family protein [Glaesserella sp. 15-184]RAL19941.1 TIGR00156 family protein [Glaesserella australis]